MRSDCLGGCPFQEILDLLGRRYALSVIWALHHRSPRRFNELKSDLGVNPVTLSQRLTELEGEGMLLRVSYSETPPRVEYSLTVKGKELLPLIGELERWAERHPRLQAPVGNG
jgi:DNA-binding HxlR family transcriptional regulator